ncbi:hypothetical protein OAX78_01925 [Planctomycetota bacterium]|nr:hypothetical protein [Planctomycetota bacterium]
MSDSAPKKPQLVFPTYGVHNPPEYSKCAHPDGVYPRTPDEPSDPQFPPYFTAKWTMYRVFKNYAGNLPPYDGAPPAPMVEGEDYEVSYGATYYDSEYVAADGTVGAMMEHYEKRSLPILPRSNHYSSSFISLGNTAYFVTYEEDRPEDLPPICVFSDLNHAPRRDFVKHLPYSKGDSDQLDGKIQGYSLWTSPGGDKPPVQTGVSPDRTADQCVMFGYGFHSEATPDCADKAAAPYRHPQSFYFSGMPVAPANAPFVSQHYTEFSMKRPDPAETWDLVEKVSGGKPIPLLNLFTMGGTANVMHTAAASWAGPGPQGDA